MSEAMRRHPPQFIEAQDHITRFFFSHATKRLLMQLDFLGTISGCVDVGLPTHPPLLVNYSRSYDEPSVPRFLPCICPVQPCHVQNKDPAVRGRTPEVKRQNLTNRV
jgi:hypothetical protein